jgi:hypothetical protein
LFECFRLKSDDSRGNLDRSLRETASGKIAIEISASEHNYDRQIRMLAMKSGYRSVTATRVQSDHQVPRFACIRFFEAY